MHQGAHYSEGQGKYGKFHAIQGCKHSRNNTCSMMLILHNSSQTLNVKDIAIVLFSRKYLV